MLNNRYHEVLDLEIGTTDSGVEVPSLSSLQDIGGTRLSKELNQWVFDIIKIYFKEKSIEKILHFMESDIGAFCTIGGENVRHHDFKIGSTSSRFKEDSGSGKRLFLLDFSDLFRRGGITQSVRDIFSFIGNDDEAFICCESDHLFSNAGNHSYDGVDTLNVRNLMRDAKLSIKAMFGFSGAEFYGPATLETDSWTPLSLSLGDGGGHFYLVLVGRNRQTKEFTCESKGYSKKQLKNTIDNCVLERDSGSLETGIFVEPNKYFGPVHRNLTLVISKLEKELDQYALMSVFQLIKRYEKIEITEINRCPEKYNKCFLYSPYSPRFFKISELKNIEDGHKDIYAIYFDNTLVEDLYISHFFREGIGNNLFKLVKSVADYEFGSNHIELDNLSKIRIPVPPLGVQLNIIKSLELSDRVKYKISKFSIDFLNCLSSVDGNYAAIGKIEKILEIFDELSEYEKIKKIINGGESKTVEFKQTFSLDIAKKTKEKYIEDSCIKTIAAFLNSDGGCLIIGVADDKNIIGLEEEISKFHKSEDKFLLHFKNSLKLRIGEQYYPFIDVHIVQCDGKTVVKVDCKMATSEVYVDLKDFYVRTNPATDRLEGPKVVEYIRHHFKNI